MDRFLVAVVGLFLFSQQIWAREPLDPQEVAEIIEQFQFEATYEETKSYKDGGFFSRCWLYEKEFETSYPGAEKPLRVTMNMYIPNRDRLGDEQVPAVVLLPPIGGVNILDRSTAETLCDYGMAGIILSNDFANIQKQAKGDLLPPDDHQETFYRISAAIKGTMTMVDQDPNLDYGKMGIFGVSLGGILGSFVMTTQPDIAAGYFVVAGGDIPRILATSDQDEVSTIRRKRMQTENIESQEEYELFLRKNITLDPVDLAMTMLPETLNMVIAERDSAVPTPNQFMLHEAFGEPTAAYYDNSHVSTVISSLFPGSGRRRIARFFEERFERPNPRPGVFSRLWAEQPLAAN
jgi:hypothetical protein